jgi:hypothetical protein
MKKIKLISTIILVLTSLSCSTKNRNINNNSDKKNELDIKSSKLTDNDSENKKIEKNKNEVEEENFDYSNTVIKSDFYDTIRINFSNNENKDLFTFTMPKGNINNTKSVLKIYDFKGKIIYEKTFETFYLINGYDLYNIKNQSEMDKYIYAKAKNILDKDSFENANKTQFHSMDKEMFENYEVYVECKKNNFLLYTVGLGEEDITTIGYSKKLDKTIDIFYCC